MEGYFFCHGFTTDQTASVGQSSQMMISFAGRVVSTIGRHQLFSVKVEGGVAHPAFKESGAITSMSLASGYVEIPANVEYVEEGSRVVVNFY